MRPSWSNRSSSRSSRTSGCRRVHRLVRRPVAWRCKRHEAVQPCQFRQPGEQGRWGRPRPIGCRTDGCGPAARGNPWTAPGNALFGWAVQAEHISAASKDGLKSVERCVPHLFCRVRGAVRKEKRSLKSLSSWQRRVAGAGIETSLPAMPPSRTHEPSLASSGTRRRAGCETQPLCGAAPFTWPAVLAPLEWGGG